MANTQDTGFEFRMADKHLKSELEKEEVLLKNVREKLMDQLQRLKVEELALTKYLSMLNASKNPSTSTVTYFSQQVNPSNSEASECDDQINSVPLSGLTENLSSNTLVSSRENHGEEEEEEEEEEEMDTDEGDGVN